MEAKPTFKNLINLDKEKFTRSRSKSKSPNNRSTSKSVSRDFGLHKPELASTIPVQPLAAQKLVPETSSKLAKEQPIPSYDEAVPDEIDNTQTKISYLQESFCRLQRKLNNMFCELPSRSRFENEETQILQQSAVDYQNRLRRLQQKLGKTVIPFKETQLELIERIQSLNRRQGHSAANGGESIANFKENLDYQAARLDLSCFRDRLSRLQSATS